MVLSADPLLLETPEGGVEGGVERMRSREREVGDRGGRNAFRPVAEGVAVSSQILMVTLSLNRLRFLFQSHSDGFIFTGALSNRT
jgi:hypothetical protein